MKRRGAFCLSKVRRKEAELLMHQQFHVMGRDVESRHGNLLLAFGGIRLKSPYQQTASLYTFNLSRTRRIVFRGFGVFIGDDRLGGLFIHRKKFEVRTTRSGVLHPIPWFPSQSPPPRSPKTVFEKNSASELLTEMVGWFCRYEEWIQTKYGRRFRAGQLVHFRSKGNLVWKWDMLEGWNTILEWL